MAKVYKGNKCLKCEEGELKTTRYIEVDYDLATKNGAILVPSGSFLTQADQKKWWTDMPIRGPLICKACGAEHFYVPGAKNPLMSGSYADAMACGPEAFLEES